VTIIASFVLDETASLKDDWRRGRYTVPFPGGQGGRKPRTDVRCGSQGEEWTDCERENEQNSKALAGKAEQIENAGSVGRIVASWFKVVIRFGLDGSPIISIHHGELEKA